MPKPLFYLGVIFSSLIAVLAVSAASAQFSPAEPQLLQDLNPLRPISLLVLAVPVAALFLRMASLIAARNLFAAQFAVFAIACTTLGAGLLSTVQFRALVMMKGNAIPAAVEALSELQLVVLYALGFFFSIALLSIRPYFRLQGRALAAMVLIPAPLYLAMLAEQYVTAPAMESSLGVTSVLTSLYLLLVAATFAAVSVHCVRHRHLFVEVTNLRAMLDTRAAVPVRPRNGFRFDGSVAFDS